MNLKCLKAGMLYFNNKNHHLILKFNGDLYCYNSLTGTSNLLEKDVTDMDGNLYIKNNTLYNVIYNVENNIFESNKLFEVDDRLLGVNFCLPNQIIYTSHDFYILEYIFYDYKFVKVLYKHQFNETIWKVSTRGYIDHILKFESGNIKLFLDDGENIITESTNLEYFGFIVKNGNEYLYGSPFFSTNKKDLLKMPKCKFADDEYIISSLKGLNGILTNKGLYNIHSIENLKLISSDVSNIKKLIGTYNDSYYITRN